MLLFNRLRSTLSSTYNISSSITKTSRILSSRQFGSKDDNGANHELSTGKQEPPKPGKCAYVHPLSQIVLEHLQCSRSSFLIETGLDTGLTINQDGTFVLRFPKTKDIEENEDDSRIWTSYDPKEKKHWLTVKKGDLVGRYLLQDNLKPAWHSSRLSTPQKVQEAVDQMITKIQEKE